MRTIPAAGQTAPFIPHHILANLGYLQEMNRLFLHPLGLSMGVFPGPNGETMLAVEDHRNDPDGCAYASGLMSAAKRREILDEMAARQDGRLAAFGYVHQPVSDASEIFLDDYRR